jgi:hypothetical protein
MGHLSLGLNTEDGRFDLPTLADKNKGVGNDGAPSVVGGEKAIRQSLGILDPIREMIGDVQKLKRPDIVVPEEATDRGTILKGELRSKERKFPEMLVQFGRLDPRSRRGRIFFYPTAEQARKLFGARGPFSFEGSVKRSEDITEYHKASGIWPNSGSEIRHGETIYLSQFSGQMGDLETRQVFSAGLLEEHRDSVPYAWFTANSCFLLRGISNSEIEEKNEAKKFSINLEDIHIVLSGGATAEVRRHAVYPPSGLKRKTEKVTYSIHVWTFKDAQQVKVDVDALLILASFASRERSVSSHWRSEMAEGESVSRWRFNFDKFPPRAKGEEPLIVRDRDSCRKFIQKAFEVYNRGLHKELLESAIYALLDVDIPLEIRIVRLFAGIQGTMMFALQEPRRTKRPTIDALNRKISKRWPNAFDDLWPLLDPRSGISLAGIRNAIAHGDAFSEDDTLALSYAGENLRWYLERLILLSLGWDIQESTVSPRYLGFYYAHRWQPEQTKLQV